MSGLSGKPGSVLVIKTTLFFFLRLFDVDHFKSIEFVTLLLFYVLVFWPQGMWDLSYPHQESNTHCVH